LGLQLPLALRALPGTGSKPGQQWLVCSALGALDDEPVVAELFFDFFAAGFLVLLVEEAFLVDRCEVLLSVVMKILMRWKRAEWRGGARFQSWF